MAETARALLEYIGMCTSPCHTAEVSAARLREAGFQELALSGTWELVPEGRYFLKGYDSALLAFVVGRCSGELRIAAAHTDFPCFRLKPKAGMERDGYGLLNVEPYGGMILRSWLDRPLSLAGKVVLRGKDAFHPEGKLVDFERPLFTIPGLAIHMDREVNEKGELNPQKDMLPLARLSAHAEAGDDGGEDEEAGTKDFFLEWLSDELMVSSQDILSYELSAYPVEDGCMMGLGEEFISSPRLDNLTSAKACLEGILASAPAEGIRLIALFDHEEVGSRTKQGAASGLLMQVLERIYLSLSKPREELFADIAKGFLLSVDVAHGLHPNHPDKSDPALRPLLGGGVVLKQAASQSYAGDAEAVAIVRSLCEEHGIPWQHFVNRSDSKGGSTLGSIASALVSMRAMDIGVPILAMHSARELMGAADQEALEKLMKVFLL